VRPTVDISFQTSRAPPSWAAGVDLAAAVRWAGREVLQHPRDPRAAFDSHGCEELCVGGQDAVNGVTAYEVIVPVLPVVRRRAVWSRDGSSLCPPGSTSRPIRRAQAGHQAGPASEWPPWAPANGL